MKSVSPVLEIYSPSRSQSWRRVEKASSSSRLDEDKRRAPDAEILNRPMKAAANASRFDTHSSTGFISEATPPGFIAQILGQVLATKKTDAARCMRAYAEAGRDPADINPIGWV